MKSVVVVLILAVTVTLGVLNARRFLRDAADPVLTAFHPLLGIGGLVVLLFSVAASEGTGILGPVAAGLLAAAVFCAVLSALLRGARAGAANVLLVTHAVCGATGFLAALGWALL